MSEKERLVKVLSKVFDVEGINKHFKDLSPALCSAYLEAINEACDYILDDRRRVLNEIEAILDRSHCVAAVRLAKNKIDELRKG